MKIECEQPYCNYIEVLQRDAEKTIYRMNCGDGDGIMVCYPVFDGVELYYNDFQAFRCSEPGNRPGSNFLARAAMNAVLERTILPISARGI